VDPWRSLTRASFSVYTTSGAAMNIVLTGSVAYDYLMKFPGYFKEHILPEKLESISLSFLVESMVRLRGGIAPNIAYTLALLGEHPRVMATVGEDFEDYRAWLESKGVDTTEMHVIPGEFTASFFCNTDRSNAQIASFYAGAMSYASQLSFRKLVGERPELVVISPNDPQAMDSYVDECQELSIPYIYDPSQQLVRMEAKSIQHGIQGALALFVNEYESFLIEKMTGMKADDIREYVRFLVITRGQDGAEVYAGDQVYRVPCAPPLHIEDPTGVGDAFRGGFLTGYLNGLSLETCAQMGALAATYCLEQHGPQGHSFTLAEFTSRFRSHFDDHGQLDKLLVKMKN
jgi:adenosine kinase